jgi:hypothetical protein
MIRSFLMAASLAVSTASIAGEVANNGERHETRVPFRVIPAQTYANFPMWNMDESPKLFSLVKTLDQYKSVFHGIFFPGKPALPPEDLFSRDQIIVVALTMKAIAPEDWDKAFSVASVTESEDQVILRYSVNPIPPKADWIQKNALSVAIPQKNYSELIIIDQATDREEARLKLSEGQWSIPPVK